MDPKDWIRKHLEEMKECMRDLDRILQDTCRNMSHECTMRSDKCHTNGARAPIQQSISTGDQCITAESYMEAIAHTLSQDPQSFYIAANEDTISLRTPNFHPLSQESTDWWNHMDFQFLTPLCTCPLHGTRNAYFSASNACIPAFLSHLSHCLQSIDHLLIPSHADKMSALFYEELNALFAENDIRKLCLETMFPNAMTKVHVSWDLDMGRCGIQMQEAMYAQSWCYQCLLVVRTDVRVSAKDKIGTENSIASLDLSTEAVVSLNIQKHLEEKGRLRVFRHLQAFSVSFCDANGKGQCRERVETGTLHALSLNGAKCGQLTFEWSDIPSRKQPLYLHHRIVQVAASLSHFLFLDDFGMVFTAGRNDNGCLGHGNCACVSVEHPMLIQSFSSRQERVCQVACGEDAICGAHSMALTVDGKVYSWGSGVATGRNRVDDCWEPEKVVFRMIGIEEPVIRSIACGSGFSIAVSQSECAYAWGKYSDGRLGLGPIPVLNRSSRRYGTYKQLMSYQLWPKALSASYKFEKVACGEAHCVAIARVNNIAQIVTWGKGMQGQLGHGSLDDCFHPQVLSFPENDLSWFVVAAGRDWSMALDDAQRVWTWGACGGPQIGHVSESSIQKCLSDSQIVRAEIKRLREMQHSVPIPPFSWLRPHLLTVFQDPTRMIRAKSISAGLDHGALVTDAGHFYRWAKTLHFSLEQENPETQLNNSNISAIFCGGHSTFCISDQTILSNAFKCLLPSLIDYDQLHGMTSSREFSDVCLVVGTQRIPAHQVILAKRSFVFQKLLLEAQRPGRVTELVLCNIRSDVAICLLQYMYTSEVDFGIETQYFEKSAAILENALLQTAQTRYLLQDVLRAAKLYKVVGLEKLCLDKLGIDNTLTMIGGLDLTGALNEKTWSDVIIRSVDHYSFYVHRCILSARSKYFEWFFKFNADECVKESVIHVEEEQNVMLPLLRFIYSDKFEVCEDFHSMLEVSIKYGIYRLQQVCESGTGISVENVLEVLDLSHRLGAFQLKERALNFIQTHLVHICATKEFDELSRDQSELLVELYNHLKLKVRDEILFQEWQRDISMENESAEDIAKDTGAARFPLKLLLATLLFGVCYIAFMRAAPPMTAWVPIVNSSVLVAFIAFGAFGSFDR